MISQQEIAEKLGITRSSVAVHITNLSKKGIIKGRSYVLDEKNYVSVVGGINIDIVGFPEYKLVRKDSNPGKALISLGGVGRNIAENLTKMELNTKLFSIIGSDYHGDQIIEESRAVGLDVDYLKISESHSTGTYLAILDEDHDMDIAISSMDILNYLDIDYIKENRQVLGLSDIIVFDTNINKDVLEYATDILSDNKMFLDTVSYNKALRAKDIVGRFHTIKPNRIEAEALSGIKIKDKKDLDKASDFFHKKGVVNVFITLSEKGVFYSDGKESGIFKAEGVKPVNATGAGDAFQAGLVYAEVNNFSLIEKTKFATAASIVAMTSNSTINEKMSINEINKIIKNMEESYE